MLSALSTIVQQTEANLLVFINRVSARSGLSKEDLLLLWKEVNSPVVEAPKVIIQPAVEAPKPVSQSVVEAPKVVVEVPKPVVEASKPASQPVVEAPKPASQPVVEEPKPVSQPVVEVPKPVSQPVVAQAPKVVSKPVVEAPKPASKQSLKPMVIEDDSDNETDVKARCRHIMVSGKSKGSTCGAPAKENGLCNKHKASTTAIKRSENSVPKTQDEKENSSSEPVNEFVKLTSREEEKRIEFRVKTREIILNKVYPPVPVVEYKNYKIVENTKVVLNEEKTAIIGYLDEKEQLVRMPTQATDKVVLEYGISFDASHINDSDIDD